ncbi:hypothetical protein [Novipirellula rosea]|uniref:hypothetical protein n=1 Tax=Novipirellula rosea TaxID=1031540 RepID=UPI0031EB82C7
MENQDRESTFLLLASATTLTLSTVGLTTRWEYFGWSYATPILFLPMFLASIYSGLRWFGVDTSLPILGVAPRVFWPVAGVILAGLMEPAVFVIVFVIMCILGIGWWFLRQFQLAEEITEAKRRKQSNNHGV